MLEQVVEKPVVLSLSCIHLNVAAQQIPIFSWVGVIPTTDHLLNEFLDERTQPVSGWAWSKQTSTEEKNGTGSRKHAGSMLCTQSRTWNLLDPCTGLFQWFLPVFAFFCKKSFSSENILHWTHQTEVFREVFFPPTNHAFFNRRGGQERIARHVPFFFCERPVRIDLDSLRRVWENKSHCRKHFSGGACTCIGPQSCPKESLLLFLHWVETINKY